MNRIKRQAPEFASGFAKMVVDSGYGAKSTVYTDGRGNALTLQAVGREMFGAAVFNDALRVELAKRKVGSGDAT